MDLFSLAKWSMDGLVIEEIKTKIEGLREISKT